MTNLNISAECIAARIYEDLTGPSEDAIQDLALHRMHSTPEGRLLAKAFDEAAESINFPADDPMYKYIESAFCQELDHLTHHIIGEVAMRLLAKALTPPENAKVESDRCKESRASSD